MAIPLGLSERSARLWRSATRGGCRSPERRALLEEALRCLDVADRARDLVDRDGLLMMSARSKVTRINPAVRIEAEARASFVKLWRILRLDFDADADER